MLGNGAASCIAFADEAVIWAPCSVHRRSATQSTPINRPIGIPHKMQFILLLLALLIPPSSADARSNVLHPGAVPVATITGILVNFLGLK
jgi:hypothetical protein